MRATLNIGCLTFLVLSVLSTNAQDTLLIPEVVITAKPYLPPTSSYVQQIDSIAIQSYQGRSLSDLLLQQSAVTIKDYGPGGISSLNVRGTGASNTQVFWEGFSLNNQMLGQSDLKLFPIFFADQVELHYGNAGMVDGIGGIGGNIMINNQPSYSNQLSLNVGGRFSSINERTALVSFKKSTNKWFVNLRTRFEDSDNEYEFRNYVEDDRRDTAEFNGTESFHLMVHSGYQWTEKSSFGLSAFFVNRSQELSPIIGLEPKGEIQEDQISNLLLKYAYESDQTKVDFSTTLMANDIMYDNDSLVLTAEHQIQSWRTLTGVSQKITTGLDLKVVVSTELTQAESDSYEGTKERTHHAAQTRLVWYKLPRFKSDMLLRVESIDNNMFYLPMFSSEYKPLANYPVWMFASIGKNIRYPTLNELYWEISGNEDLQAQEAVTIEGGVRVSQKRKEMVSGTINVFHSLVDNWILWLPQGNVWKPQNVRQVVSYGLETGMAIRFLQNKNLQSFHVNYSYTKSEVKANYKDEDNTIGNQLIYTPEHSFTANWQSNFRTYFMIWRINYAGKMYINPENTAYLPHSTPVDVSIGKEWNEHENFPLKLQLTCHNLLDEEIQYVAHRTIPGRYFSLDFNIGFEN